MRIIFFTYDYNEALSVVSRMTIHVNERQVKVCQVYVARIIGEGGGGGQGILPTKH